MKNSFTTRAKQVLKETQRAIARLDTSIPALEDGARLLCERKGTIAVTGIGKSGFIGKKIAATFTSLGQRAVFLHPVEAVHGDIGFLSKGDVLIALSYSGESKEVVKITAYAKKQFSVQVIALTKSRTSSLGKLADVVAEVHTISEGSPNGQAPMASTTATLVLGDMLAAMLVDNTFKDQHYAQFHPGGALGLNLKKVRDVFETDRSVPFVLEKDFIGTVLEEMTQKELGITGVLNTRGKLVGVITDGDIRRALLRNADMRAITARDIMTKEPKHVRDTMSLKEALSEMETHRITSLFVIGAQSRPIGIIHIHDIAGATFVGA